MLDAKDKDNTGSSNCQANQQRRTEQWTRGNPPDVEPFTQGNNDVMTCEVPSKPDCKDDTNHLALVDSGANGTMAGEDCRFIGQCSMGRMVDSTGIDNHQMTDIKIGTCTLFGCGSILLTIYAYKGGGLAER